MQHLHDPLREQVWLLSSSFLLLKTLDWFDVTWNYSNIYKIRGVKKYREDENIENTFLWANHIVWLNSIEIFCFTDIIRNVW